MDETKFAKAIHLLRRYSSSDAFHGGCDELTQETEDFLEELDAAALNAEKAQPPCSPCADGIPVQINEEGKPEHYYPEFADVVPCTAPAAATPAIAEGQDALLSVLKAWDGAAEMLEESLKTEEHPAATQLQFVRAIGEYKTKSRQIRDALAAHDAALVARTREADGQARDALRDIVCHLDGDYDDLELENVFGVNGGRLMRKYLTTARDALAASVPSEPNDPIDFAIKEAPAMAERAWDGIAKDAGFKDAADMREQVAAE